MLSKSFCILVVHVSVDYKLIFLTGQVVYRRDVYLTVSLCGPSVNTCWLLMDCEEVNTNL